MKVFRYFKNITIEIRWGGLSYNSACGFVLVLALLLWCNEWYSAIIFKCCLIYLVGFKIKDRINEIYKINFFKGLNGNLHRQFMTLAAKPCMSYGFGLRYEAKLYYMHFWKAKPSAKWQLTSGCNRLLVSEQVVRRGSCPKWTGG